MAYKLLLFIKEFGLVADGVVPGGKKNGQAVTDCPFFVGCVADKKEQTHSSLSFENPILRIDFIF